MRPPAFVSKTLSSLENAGFSAYLVGGCVRDSLLGRTPHDWDIATAARPREIEALFPKTAPTGEKYGTVTVLTADGNIEVTTFRADGDYPDGARAPASVTFTRDIFSDLSRRDFTMNAIAQSASGELIDPFSGGRDLDSRLIRCVGDPAARFTEDALRMLRALRFSAQLGFTVEPDTLAAIEVCAPRVRALSRERVRDELARVLLSPAPEIAAVFVSLGLLEPTARQIPLAPERLAALKTLPEELPPRLAAFTAVLMRENAATERLPAALRLPAQTARDVSAAALAAQAEIPPDGALLALKRLDAALGDPAARCAAAAHDVLHGTRLLSALAEMIKTGEPRNRQMLAVTGADLLALGIPPGPALGRILDDLLSHVLAHPKDNERGILLSRIPRP